MKKGFKQILGVIGLSILPLDGFSSEAKLPELSRKIRADLFDPVLSETASRIVNILLEGAGVEKLEHESYRLYLDASRFRRHYGDESWAAVSDVVSSIFGETKARLLAHGGLNTAVTSIERYEKELAKNANTRTR
jgi:hypothetical protein